MTAAISRTRVLLEPAQAPKRIGLAIGTDLGGIRTLEDVRLRCWCDPDTGCWHLRSARGRPMPRGRRHVLWLGDQRRTVSAPRAVWELRTGKPVPAGKVVSRTCASYDCVSHLRCWTKAEEGAYLAKRGSLRTTRRTIANRREGALRSRFPPELRQWIAESSQTALEVAHAMECSGSWVSSIRVRARPVLGANTPTHRSPS